MSWRRFVREGFVDGFRQPFFWLCWAMIILALVFLVLDRFELTVGLLALAALTLYVDVRTGPGPGGRGGA